MGTSGDRFRKILCRAIDGKRLSVEEALALYEAPLPLLGEAAKARTQKLHPSPFRTYHVDRNINYTNICVSGCRFCAFWRKPNSPDAFVIDWDTLRQKIEETIALGGDQILLQGGLHPDLPLEWYEDLLRQIKRTFPGINIHGFSPPEIHHLSKISGLSVRDVLQRLRAAGLGTLPGGGAEILVDRVRESVSPHKVSAAGWLEVMQTWHHLGGRSSATMMFGHVETRQERIEHLAKIRALQDETGGFIAFIPWTFQPGNTALANLPRVGTAEYLRTLAIARLFLDNFVNIQASWVTQGLAVAQVALHFGANDLGSVMIEENVVAATGVRFRTTEAEIRQAIRDAGFVPRRRNVYYQLIDAPEAIPPA
ncbi:MAG: dehypoxanthine futalosine cyclase [Thermoguttaceae bacterium]|nr:dehypoxanthine futalosine cyclase [Thermoguttaceae bacterium]MDW8078259.1 cyclic dehypoxanthinyl futalosine synthase [Thermoguttaceae bacterium]